MLAELKGTGIEVGLGSPSGLCSGQHWRPGPCLAWRGEWHTVLPQGESILILSLLPLEPEVRCGSQWAQNGEQGRWAWGHGLRAAEAWGESLNHFLALKLLRWKPRPPAAVPRPQRPAVLLFLLGPCYPNFIPPVWAMLCRDRAVCTYKLHTPCSLSSNFYSFFPPAICAISSHCCTFPCPS